MQDAKQELEAVLESIRHSDEIDPEDKSLLQEYNRETRRQRSQIGYKRRLKMLKHLRLLAGHSQKYGPDELPDARLVDTLEDEDAVNTFLDWIHQTYDNEETNRDYRVALRSLGKHTTSGDDLPPTIEKVSASTSRDYDPKPDPAKMYRWEDHVIPMIEASPRARDKAAIALQWDAGLRSGEFRDLRIGDLTDHDYGLSVSVDGKRGERSVLLVPSVSYVQKWVYETHPTPDDPSAPLWCKHDAPEEISYKMKSKIFKRAAEKADIIPPSEPTFTQFRKSSVSRLASQNVNQANLERRYGWKHGSDTAARYISVFGEAKDRAIAEARGVEIDEEDQPDPIAGVECPRCDAETPRHRPFCVWCGQALTQAAREQIDAQEDRLFNSLAEADNPDVQEAVVEFRDLLDEHPEVQGLLLDAEE